jgi:hypothetical protein
VALCVFALNRPIDGSSIFPTTGTAPAPATVSQSRAPGPSGSMLTHSVNQGLSMKASAGRNIPVVARPFFWPETRPDDNIFVISDDEDDFHPPSILMHLAIA